MEPAGLSSGLVESARLPPSRMTQGSSTPSAPGPMAPGASTPSLGRNNSTQRSFKPVLQKRDSRDQRMWPKGPPPPVSRSTSADRQMRPRVPPVRRPCRTLSPPEQKRTIGTGPRRGQGSFTPAIATPPLGAGPILGGTSCPHRFRGAAIEPEVPDQRRGLPVSAQQSSMPKVLPPPADFDTPRSPSLKEDSRSSPPSTVPQVLSGTPGSPHREVPDFEGLCGVVGSSYGASGLSALGGVASQQPLCLDNNWKFSLDNDQAALSAGGVHADFVHVDEDEMPNGLQDLRRAHAATASGEPAGRCPLSLDCSNLMTSPAEASIDQTNVSFNLSPIKRAGAGAPPPSIDAGRAIDFTRCFSRPPSPRSHAPAPLETMSAQRSHDAENQENIPVHGGSESKVAAMRQIWEQRSSSSRPNGRGRSSSTTAYNVVVGRGRSSSREALGRSTSFEEQRLHGASLSRIGESMCKRLKKQEETTKRYTKCLDDLIRRLDRTGADTVVSPAKEQDSIISDSISEGSPQPQDSPTTKMCRSLSKSFSVSFRNQRHLTKVVMKVLNMDVGQPRPCPCCAGTCVPSHEAPLASTISIAPSIAVPSENTAEGALPDGKSMPDFKDGRCTVCGDVALEIQSPPSTPQPEEEADGPLPRKSGDENALPPRKSKLLAAEEAITDRAVVEGSRNSTISDAEPAREPQPLGQSPRDPIEELSSSTDTPLLESPGGATSSSWARPSASGPEHEEGLVTEADSSLNSSALGEEASPAASVTNEDELIDYSCIRPGEDGMDRMHTMLHMIEQSELKRELYIMVPEGIGIDRKVIFSYENKSHEVALPEGYKVGEQVLITLTNRPFLERTAAQALRRGHQQPEFHDKWSIIDNLRHSLRTDADCSTLTADEFRHRYHLYMLLRGKSGTPLLPFTEEEHLDDPMVAH